MRKSAITIAVLIMSAGLIGIILLQINWIRHDYRLREQQFDQQVHEAMKEVVDKLETRHAFSLIRHRFFNLPADSSFWKVVDSSMVSWQGDGDTMMLTGGNGKRISRVPEGKPDDIQLVIADSVQTGNKRRSERILINTDSAMTSTEINRVRVEEEVLRRDVMEIRNELMEAEVEKERIRKEQELVQMKVKINSRMGKMNEVLNKIYLSYLSDEYDPILSLQPAVVDSLLKKELKNNGVSTRYHFSILDSKKDSVIAMRDTTAAESLADTPYSVDLFPNELVSKGHLLNLHFPSRTTFVLSSLSWMLAGSVIFTLTIILVFFYTIQMLLRQKELSDIKSDFINNMTHEFKTPIATIGLAIDAINNPRISSDREKVTHYSDIIREENKRMNEQVETILQTALFDKKDFKIRMRDLDFHALVRKAVGKLEMMIGARGGRIDLALEADNHRILGDEVLLTTVLVNLLDNANKYSPETPEITVATRNRENGILFSVQDNGMGMDRETVNRVFEKFYRLSTGNVHDVKGFGLGLSNVKSIVTAHGGEVKAISEPGKGSRFEIYLPLTEQEQNK